MTAKQKYDKILDRSLPPIVIEAIVIVCGIAIHVWIIVVLGLIIEANLLYFFFKETHSLKDDGDHVADCQRYISR